MRVTVTFRHMESSEPLRSYAEEKTARIARYLTEPAEVHWVLSVEKRRHNADATVVAGGLTIKAHEDTQDLYAAIDTVIDKLEKQVKRHKEKVKNHKAAPAVAEAMAAGAGAAAAPASQPGPRIVKTENQFVKPMSVEEATLQMDMVDNDFLVFTDSSTNNISVIYRRSDGNYGLIETRTR
ncbi:MAG TPA: ribosome-associated translation inhibitor RaiA [Deltaproteobacteria bacterium]|nr:ribosome-associated translation inhibitor RaiA [Deltaproteobacteria bacterium]